MLEANLTRLFSLEAAADEPAAAQSAAGQAAAGQAAAAISIPAARHSARMRRYRHRALVIATPVMAAAAVVAIIAGATLLTIEPAASPGKKGPVTPSSAELRQGFDPMRVYASFGWLPAGVSVSSGETSRTEESFYFQGGMIPSLTLHQPGRCWLQHVSASLAEADLHCSDNSPPGGNRTITGRAPSVGGHPAYWATQNGLPLLIWAYSAGAWAELHYFSCAASQLPANEGFRCIKAAEVVEVARRARIGVPVGSIVFPAVLSNVPTNWQVDTTGFTVQHGYLAAGDFQITAGPLTMAPESPREPVNTPYLSFIPTAEEKALTDAFCHGYDSFPGDRHPHVEVINGYRVLSGYVRAPDSPTYQACSPDADGQLVFIVQLGAHPPLSVTAVFSRLHLLGTNPADWTTKPLG
jgi:hypothetical protein